MLTTSGQSSLSSFPDRSFIEHAAKEHDYRGSSAVRSMTGLGENEPKQVVSMYKNLPLPFGSQGLLVINVRLYRLEQMINLIINDSVSFLKILDSSVRRYRHSGMVGADRKSQRSPRERARDMQRVPLFLYRGLLQAGSAHGGE
ncbi:MULTISPECIES: hypothetical protein [Paenibacillus]|uniref:hypothetical protein n=1 Tax=Paenibacillus TaxID=44249 RepID=UPI0021172327|nr:hypothetical protein [Paenibacillus lautus]